MSSKSSENASAVKLLDPAELASAGAASSVHASFALIFHTRCTHLSRPELGAITAHSIRRDGRGAATIQPGNPLDPTEEMRLLECLRPSTSARFEVYPENLLFANALCMVWWMPSQRRNMVMRSANGTSAERPVVWPSLVMLTFQHRLFVAAVAQDVRPNADTALYFAPLGNVYKSTEMCTGNIALPSEQSVAAMEKWQAVVTDTAFTHDNNRGQSLRVKGRGKHTSDPMDFWAVANHAKFPKHVLVPIGTTISSWVVSITGQGDAP